jgi:CBS domain-containing protein
MSIDDLIRKLAEAEAAAAPVPDSAVAAFAEACRRTDRDPQEEKRLRALAELTDLEDASYGWALDALRDEDWNTALPLLRDCAAKGIGESSWLLAQALEQTGHRAEAAAWYQAAAEDGDGRAAARLAALRSRPGPDARPARAGHGSTPYCTAVYGTGTTASQTPAREFELLPLRFPDYHPVGRALLARPARGGRAGETAAALDPASSRTALAGLPPRRPPVAADLMLPLSDLPACSPDTTVQDALLLMARACATALPVYTGGRADGVITIGGLTESLQRNPWHSPIRQVAELVRPLAAIAADLPLCHVREKAAEDSNGLLVVHENGELPVGYLVPRTVLSGPPGSGPRPARPRSLVSLLRTLPRLPRLPRTGGRLR